MKFHPIFHKPYQKWWLVMAVLSLINFLIFGFPATFENKDYGYFFYTLTALLAGLVYGSILYLVYWLFSRKWDNKIFIILISITWLFCLLIQNKYDMDDKAVLENNIEFKDYSSLDVKLNEIGYYHSEINNFRVQIPENWTLQKGQVLGTEISALAPDNGGLFILQICNLNKNKIDIDNLPDNFFLKFLENKRAYDMKTIESKLTTIANQKTKYNSFTLSYSHLNEMLNFHIESYVFIYDDRIYHLLFKREIEQKDNYQLEFKNILNSFMLEYYK